MFPLCQLSFCFHVIKCHVVAMYLITTARAWMCLFYVWKILLMSVFCFIWEDKRSVLFFTYVLVCVVASCCFSPFLNYSLFGFASTFETFRIFHENWKTSHLFIFLSLYKKRTIKIPISPFVSCNDGGGAIRLITRWISPLYDKYWFKKKNNTK